MARLTLDDVTFHYPATGAPALSHVSMTVDAGDVVALVGDVGAGASTLLLVAAGLAPRVTGGTIYGTVTCDGSRVLALPTPWTQVSGMAFTVWDEVAFGPANLGWPRERIARQVDQALARLDITALARRDPTTLSGGELQRVILAGILATDPAVILLDEPTAELDPEGAARVWGLIGELAHEGRAVVVATSDVDAVPTFATRVAWLAHGAIKALGTPAEVLGNAAAPATAVARVWRAAKLHGAAPFTVADAVARLA